MRKITPLKALADVQIQEKAMKNLQELSNMITIKDKQKERYHWNKFHACMEELKERTVDRKNYGLI